MIVILHCILLHLNACTLIITYFIDLAQKHVFFVRQHKTEYIKTLQNIINKQSDLFDWCVLIGCPSRSCEPLQCIGEKKKLLTPLLTTTPGVPDVRVRGGSRVNAELF